MKITFLDFIKPILPLLFLISLYAHGENVKIKIVVNDDKKIRYFHKRHPGNIRCRYQQTQLYNWRGARGSCAGRSAGRLT
jgi:hypothetical protein